MQMRAHLRRAALVAALVAALAGCSRTTTTTSEALTGATDVPLPATSAPTLTEPADTTPAVATTTSVPPAPPVAATSTTTAAVPTTTMPPTTTTEGPLTVDDLILANNGIMPYTFGEDAPTVVARFSEALGEVVSDQVVLYPVESGDVFLDDFEETEYTFPIGRTVCWPGVCADFGGTTTDNMRFTGWSHFAGGVDGLATADGLTIGSTQAEADMNVDEGGCYWVGYGDADGIELTLQSLGIPFVEVDSDGTWISQTPDPADVEVIFMAAGDRPFFIFADC